MSDEIKCNCQFCNEHISFPTEMVGQTVACPHCGLETKLFIHPVEPPVVALSAPESSAEHRFYLLPILFFFAVLVVIATSIFYSQHKAEEKRIAEKNWDDVMHPMRDSGFRVVTSIETIQRRAAGQIKQQDFLDKMDSKTEESSDIVDRDIKLLQKETEDTITAQNANDDKSNTPKEERITRQDIEQISSWEKEMEQKIMKTAIDAKTHGAAAQDVEDAIILTIQLKQKDQ